MCDPPPLPAAPPSQSFSGAGSGKLVRRRPRQAAGLLGTPAPGWRWRDLAAPPTPREGAGGSWSAAMVHAAVWSSGFHVTAVYRLAHLLVPHSGAIGRGLAGVLSWWGRHAYGCLIAPTARLHGGLILPHPQGIVIGRGRARAEGLGLPERDDRQRTGQDRRRHVGADARIYSGMS